jgi:hypothetical protein
VSSPIWGSWPDIYFSLKIRVLFFWGVLSDEMTSLTFVYAAGPRQLSLSWVRVPWDSRPYFTVSDLSLPFLLPPTTRRVTVEVFEPASTRVPHLLTYFTRLYKVPASEVLAWRWRIMRILWNVGSYSLKTEKYEAPVKRRKLYPEDGSVMLLWNVGSYSLKMENYEDLVKRRKL